MHMPAFCRCGCGRRVSPKGKLRKPPSRNGGTSIDLKRMAKEQLRRLTDPDGSQEKYTYLTIATPREMKLTDSKRRIYDQDDINLVQGMLRDDEHLYVGVGTGGCLFFGTPRRLNNCNINYRQPDLWPDQQPDLQPDQQPDLQPGQQPDQQPDLQPGLQPDRFCQKKAGAIRRSESLPAYSRRRRSSRGRKDRRCSAHSRW